MSDRVEKDRAGGVFINVDDRMDIPAYYPVEKRNIFYFGNSSIQAYSSFNAMFKTVVMGKGKHTISLRILNNDKSGYYRGKESIMLYVYP